MDFCDYASHIRNKFRLALAIAIKKSKPETHTIDSYIEELRSKINKRYTQDNVSICSDDFNMDIDVNSPNLLEEYKDLFNDDFDVGACGETSVLGPQLLPLQKNNENSQHFDLNDIQLMDSDKNNPEMNKLNNNLFIAINDGVIESQYVDLCSKTNKNDVNTNFDAKIDKNMDRIDLNVKSNEGNINIIDLNAENNKRNLNIIDLNAENNRNLNIVDLSAENNEENLNLNSNNDIIIQNDILYDKFNRILDENLNIKKTNDIFTQEYTHISQSQTECIIIPENFLRKRHFDTKNDVSNKIVRKEPNTYNKPSSENVKKNTQDNITEFNNQMHEENLNFNKNNAEVLNPSQEFIKQKTTESQTPENLLIFEDNTKISRSNITENFNHNASQTSTADLNKYDSLFEVNLNNFEQLNSKKEEQVKNALCHIDKLIEDIKLQKEKETKHKEMNTQTEVVNDFENGNKINITDTENDENELNDIVESYTESVPSKVLMEVNKIKSFLNKSGEKRYAGSLDSGFMSDSQKFSGVYGSQSTQTCINEPAHCVLKFLTEATLSVHTQDIINDISKTLGHLVDRLHTCESYPTFLETILHNVEELIEHIYMEESMEVVTVIEIENKIQKLLLLNRSVHIIKITLENLTKKLQNTFSNLNSNSEPYEIKNLTTIENLPHVFHLLEILIKRFLTSNTASQHTDAGDTQEKKTQKSQISNFWKRKWDPNFEKNCAKLNIFEGKDINLKLSEILNKYVVSCMEKYGLIAFAALQCFNVLQSH